MADHWFILHPFCQLATEDGVPRSFQMFLMIDLGKDVHDDLVVYLGGLKNRMHDCFVGEDDVVGERLLEGTLGRTNRLRAGCECIDVFLGVTVRFVRGKRRLGVVGSGRGERRWDPHIVSAGTERVGEVETNEKASL